MQDFRRYSRLGYGMAAREVESSGNARISKIAIKAKIQAGQVKTCAGRSIAEREDSKKRGALCEAATKESITRNRRCSSIDSRTRRKGC